MLYSLNILDKKLVKPGSKLRPGSKGSSGNSHQCYGKDEDTSSSDDCDDDQGNKVCGIKFKHCDTSDCNPPGSCTCTVTKAMKSVVSNLNTVILVIATHLVLVRVPISCSKAMARTVDQSF